MTQHEQKGRAFGDTPDPGPEVGADGMEQPTEEEQLDYDMIVVRSQKMMFGEGKDNILKLLKSSERPSQGLGKAAAMLIKSLIDSAKEAGRELSGDAAMSAGMEVIENLNELAKKNGVYKYSSGEEEASELQDAMLFGVKYYGDGMLKQGDITPEMQQIAQKQVKEGLAQEQAQAPQMNPVAAGVQTAMQPQGMVAGAMTKPGGMQ